MADRVEIGRVCEKAGGHSYFIGDSDYGVCGSHEVAIIYVTVERIHAGFRGLEYTAEDAAGDIRRIVIENEKHMWDD